MWQQEFSFGDVATAGHDVRITHRAGVTGMANFCASLITRPIYSWKTVKPCPLRVSTAFLAVSWSLELAKLEAGFCFCFFKEELCKMVRNPATDSPIH